MNSPSLDTRPPTPDLPAGRQDTHAPSKIHIWILILLGWTAVFSLLSVGLLLTKNQDSGLSTTELSVACQNGALNGITMNLTRISEACTTESTESKETIASSGTAYDGKDGYLPKMTLPAGWSAEVFMNYAKTAEKPYATFTATKGIFTNCNECGGTGFPTRFYIAADDIGNLTKVEDFISQGFSPLKSTNVASIQATFAANPQLSNINVTSTALSNGTLIEITSTIDPGGINEYSGVVHMLQFSTTTKVVELIYSEHSGFEDWQILKASIDWSTIK